MAERAFLRAIGGGCHVPVGGIAIYERDSMEFIAGMADLNGERKIIVKLSGSSANPEELGINAARELLRRWSGSEAAGS